MADINRKRFFLAKPTNEYVTMNTKYNEYMKNTYENLINIANNWILEECDVGCPIYGFNGQVVGAAQKKAKKKSEIQLQVINIWDIFTHCSSNPEQWYTYIMC